MTIPSQIRETDQWILWRTETRDGRPTKVPCDATGRPVAVNDPASWLSYDGACRAFAEAPGGKLSGVGFCFTAADPFVGIDLDECLPALRGDALEILQRIQTYAEISPSGMGIKLIGIGDKGDVTRARTTEVIGFKQIEVYDRDRFFTVTGTQFGFHEDIIDVQEGLDWLIDKFLTPERGEITVSVSRPLAPAPEGSLRASARGFQGTDQQALEAMFHFDAGGKKQALWNGDISVVGDDASKADAVLVEGIAWIVGPDRGRIERIFDQSALGQRKKWLRREDYRRRTIDFVLGGMDDHYKGGPLRADSDQPRAPGPATKVDPYNVTHLGGVESQRVTWHMPNMIPKGMAVMLASAGGVVKGLLTMYVAANHIDGPVLYLGAEDNLAMIIKPRALAAGVDLDRFLPLRTVNLDDGTQVPIRFPCHADALEQAIRDYDARMVVIDAGPEHMQEGLKANGVEDVRRFMTPLNDIAERLNVTIFLILHTNKTQGASGTDRVSGNRAWVDAQRHVLLAAIDDEDDNVRHVQVGKTNISKQGIGRQYRIETKMIPVRDRDSGELVEEEVPYLVDEGPSTKDVVALMDVKAEAKAEPKLDRAILEFLKDGGRKPTEEVDSGVAEVMGVANRTVKNHRRELNKQGLIRSIPEEGPDGRVKKWLAELTWEGQDYLASAEEVDKADW